MTAQDSPDDVSQRQLLRRAATVGLLMRNTVNVIVAVTTLLDPLSVAAPLGRWLLVGLAGWSAWRLATRSHRLLYTGIDFLFTLAVCAAMPILLQDPLFHSYNTAPQAVAGTAVVSFSVSLPARVSLPIAATIAAAYALGGATISGWENLGDITALYYFALQWGTAALIRSMLHRVAAEVDRVRGERQAAELNQQVTEAIRAYEREQLALLHDTAASTLLMVGQGATMEPSRLAAQANRDLDLLHEGPWVAPPERLELVAALKNAAQHLQTPAEIIGTPEVWLPGELAKAVVAATREALNNVDRHAAATTVTVTIGPESVIVSDNGIGFDLALPRSGRGVADSILARMTRAGGRADITSSPGAGTVTRLLWSTEQVGTDRAEAADPDRLIDRVRLRYGLALTAYAVVNIAASAAYVLTHSAHVWIEIVLFIAAVLATLAALPGIIWQRWILFWPANVSLLVVLVVQSLIVDVNGVGGQAHWVQNAIGWCALPTALALPTRAGASMLVLYWTVGAGVQLARSPDAEALVNITLGTASILAVQLFALVFNGLMRDAARDAQAETTAHQRLRRRERVGQALRAEYQRRYATLVDNVMPLLEKLSATGQADERLQREARAESRRLRALFDQAAIFDHPLMQRLRPLIDGAESRAIDVVVEVAGELPSLLDDDITALTAPLARLFEVDMGSARLVVTAETDEVTVSVVCHETAGVQPDLRGETVDVVSGDDSLWILIRHTLATETACFTALK
ncbi:hypothetical protein BH11ACT7_BH11ACT7_37820 [soil metagenome]